MEGTVCIAVHRERLAPVLDHAALAFLDRIDAVDMGVRATALQMIPLSGYGASSRTRR